MFKKISIGVVVLSFCVTPGVASAHERQLFNIGGVDYLFVVGSLGEPVVVDDKTGVELRVKLADPKAPTDANAVGAKPAVGLEQSLKVEVIAGDKKKTLDLTPAFGDPGTYKNTFFPTIGTTFTYRFFGTINNTPVDLAFTCNPAGHVVAPESTTTVTLSDGVLQKFKAGAFGCPLAKESLGFPEESMTVVGMHEDVHGDMDTMMSDMAKDPEKDQSGAALAFGLLGTILGAVALMKCRKSSV